MKFQNKFMVVIAFAITTVSSFAQELEVNLQIRPRFEYRNGFKELMKDDFYPTSFVSQRSRMNFFYKQEKFKASKLEKIHFYKGFKDFSVEVNWSELFKIFTFSNNLLEPLSKVKPTVNDCFNKLEITSPSSFIVTATFA